jgi:hypothetical protein
MDLSGEDLDNVTRTILAEVGQNASPASISAISLFRAGRSIVPPENPPSS